MTEGLCGHIMVEPRRIEASQLQQLAQGNIFVVRGYALHLTTTSIAWSLLLCDVKQIWVGAVPTMLIMRHDVEVDQTTEKPGSEFVGTKMGKH